jgi:hypothetical protein
MKELDNSELEGVFNFNIIPVVRSTPVHKHVYKQTKTFFHIQYVST